MSRHARPRRSTRSNHLERKLRIIEIYSGTRENKKKKGRKEGREERRKAKRCKSGRRALAACQTDVARSSRSTRIEHERVRRLLFKWQWVAEIRIRIDDFWTRACVHRAVPRKGGKIFKFSPIGLGETGSGAFVAVIYFHDAPRIIIKIGNTRLERVQGIYFHA